MTAKLGDALRWRHPGSRAAVIEAIRIAESGGSGANGEAGTADSGSNSGSDNNGHGSGNDNNRHGSDSDAGSNAESRWQLACSVAVRAHAVPLLAPYSERVSQLAQSVARDAVVSILAVRSGEVRWGAHLAGTTIDAEPRDGDAETAAVLAVDMAMALVVRGQWLDAANFTARAHRVLDAHASVFAHTDRGESLRFDLLGLDALIEWHTFAGSTARDLLHDELSEPRSRNHLTEVHFFALAAFASISAASGDFGGAAVNFTRSLSLIPSERASLTTLIRAELVLVRVRQGRWDQASELAAELDLSPSDEDAGWLTPIVDAAHALLHGIHGDIVKADEYLVRAAQGVRAHPTVPGLTLVLHVRIALAIAVNDWADLLRHLDDAREPGYHRIYSDHEWMALRALAVWHLGRRVEQRQLLEAWGAIPDARNHAYFHTHAAILAEIDGQANAGLASITTALELVSPAYDPLGRTWVRIVAGTYVSRHSSLTDGIALYEEAYAELVAIGADGFARLCAGIIRSTSEELAGESENVLQVLTDHQRRIAEYVADGYTSAEIGQMMHLSKKTIDFHVSNIVVRLGLKSRREISRVVRPSR